MFNYFKKSYYQLLQQKDENSNESSSMILPSSIPLRIPFVLGIISVLTLSIWANVFFLYQRQWMPDIIPVSKYAHLPQDVMRPFNLDGHENDNFDKVWSLQSSDPGIIALTDSYVAQMHLPHAQRFPWDISKGIYFLQGHHNLHCLKLLRQSISEYRNQSLQSQHYLHVDHCLGALREDIICNADDTPRYTGGNHNQAGSGQDQFRPCRDWNKLDSWARENSACYKTPEDPYDGKPERENFKSCPDGSEPWL